MTSPTRSALTAALTVLMLTACLAPGVTRDEAAPLTPRVAVFAFTDPVDLPDRMIGRRASAAVHQALASEAPWDLVDPSYLLRVCEQADAQPPFAIAYLQMIGQRVNAPLAVAGMVQQCALNAERGVAQVTLVVELVDSLGGTSLNSERGVASAKRQEGETLGQALDRALTEAAANAVRALTSFDPLHAVVVTTLPDGRVVLDGPREPRIKPGAKLLVLRRGASSAELIGVLEVETSKLTVLHAKPLSGEDFRQGQHAVLIAR